MSKIAFIFPGQGAQKAGMGKDFYEQSETAKEVYNMASELLNIDMKALCFEENDKLDITEYTQAALVTTCLAMAKVVEEKGLKPDVTAGLSLGEYCAITVAGGMSVEDAVTTVRKRGILMQEAVPTGVGAMAACDVKRAKKLISDVYNIVYTLDSTSSNEQRRRVKLRHIALIDKVIETGYAYLEGEKGDLSAGEFKQISETILKALSNKAKMHGIGDKVIFEQFNIQNNTYNMTDAQKEIEKDKDKRMIIDQLETLVLEKQKSIDIIE